jgi:hypothetical protein
MGPWARAIGVLAAALGLLALPADASARPGFDAQERSLRLNLVVKGSNGFRGVIATEGHKQVSLTLIRGGVSMDLRTAETVSRRGIVARFGDLGKVSVRFQGEPPAADPGPRRRGRGGDPTPGCSGRNPIVERGHFHGTIQFRGENDFTRIDTGLAPGTVERRFRRVCRQPPRKPGAAFEELFKGLRLTQLEARARVGGVNVTFEATALDFSSILGPEFPPFYGFSARTVERREGMRVVRAAKGLGDDHSFLANKPGATPQTVTVVPPPPFVKTAEHLKEHGTPATWVGPLAVRLPGAGLVPLTGPGFRSAFCSLTFANLTEGEGEGCLPRRGDEPSSDSMALLAEAFAQGSGSQSQAFWDARLSWSR